MTILSSSRQFLRLASIPLTWGMFCVSFAYAEDDREQSLPLEVKEVLELNCVRCHGKDKRSGKLDLSTSAAIEEGGKSGSVLVPGKPNASRLFQLVQPGAKPHMPPGKQQLTSTEIAAIEKWISGLELKDNSRAGEAVAADKKSKADTWIPPRGLEPTTVIDFLIEKHWAEKKLVPTPRCSDEEFLRRLYLDVTGRVPSVEERGDFLANSSSGKREEWIDRLTESPEHAQHFATVLGTLLLGRNEGKLSQRESSGWHRYLRNAIEQNRSWGDVAEEILMARGEPEERGHIWFLYEHNENYQELAESISRSFFGVDIACAQCHDHPLAPEIEQAHYWGLVGFFRRGKKAKGKRGLAVAESAIGGFEDYANALTGETEQLRLTFLGTERTVEEPRPADPAKQADEDELYLEQEGEPRVPKFSRRERFVDQILRGNPLLAKAMVNRVWAILMGRGIIHPFDAMDSAHPPSHPEMLNWLADDFERNGYDMRRLIRGILKSRAYQLVAIDNGEPSDFAQGVLKPLSAEALLRSWAVVLDSDLESQLGRALRDGFPEVLAKDAQTSVQQTLLLSNHPGWNEVLRVSIRSSDRFKAMHAQDLHKVVSQLFELVFGRSPTAEEESTLLGFFKSQTDFSVALEQAVWAMLTSAEFRFNH